MPKTVHSDSLTVPQTRWSAVARAAQTDTGIRLKALNELLETYLPPHCLAAEVPARRWRALLKVSPPTRRSPKGAFLTRTCEKCGLDPGGLLYTTLHGMAPSEAEMQQFFRVPRPFFSPFGACRWPPGTATRRNGTGSSPFLIHPAAKAHESSFLCLPSDFHASLQKVPAPCILAGCRMRIAGKA